MRIYRHIELKFLYLPERLGQVKLELAVRGSKKYLELKQSFVELNVSFRVLLLCQTNQENKLSSLILGF